MKKKSISTILGLGILATSSLAIAQDSLAISGTMSVGAVFIDSANNLNPESSEKKLTSLNSAPKRKSSTVPAVLIDAVWDLGEEGGAIVYFSTEPPIDEVGGLTIDFGTSYEIPNIGILYGEFFASPFSEAWEDPYLVGVDRKKTDTSKYGLQLGLNRVLGTGLRMNFTYLKDEVDNDVRGKIMPVLARDGAVYAFNLNYSFYPTENLEIRPRASLRIGDYDGDANSFTKYKFTLESHYTIEKLTISPSVYYSHSDYDKENPLFSKTRDNTGYGAELMLTYMAPFNLDNWSATTLVSMSKGDSNIKYYDTESFTVAGFVSYHF